MPLVITATGTNVGKTLFSALVMARYAANLQLLYLKPVQTGADSDRETVRALTGVDEKYFAATLYSFPLAASPHYAAEQDGQTIDLSRMIARFNEPELKRAVIELAGGVVVPLTRYYTNLDLMRDAGFPVVLVADTDLGTINHTVLSHRALIQEGIHCAGIFFIGRDNELFSDNAKTILEMTRAKNLGHAFLPKHTLGAREFHYLLTQFDTQHSLMEYLQ